MKLNISAHDIHIWKARLDQPDYFAQKMEGILSEDELSRARKYYFNKDTLHFVVSRGILRILLGNYLDLKPEELIFQYGTYGKPYLEGSLQFNTSHSHGIAVYAFVYDAFIGIDIEYIRYIPDYEEIFSRFFSNYEKSIFKRIPEDQKLTSFFRCWTLKEAYIKAVGCGLSNPLSHFDVSYAPGEPAGLLRISGSFYKALKWCLKDFMPFSGYAGAIAVENKKEKRNWTFHFFDWLPENYSR